MMSFFEHPNHHPHKTRRRRFLWFHFIYFNKSTLHFKGNYNTITPFKYGGTQKRTAPFKKGNTSVGAFEFKYVPFSQRNAS